MANPRPSCIAWNNLVTASGVTFTESSEATGHPAEHLASPARWKDWRSATDTVEQTMEVDLGSIQTVYAVAVVDATLFAGGALTLGTKTTSGGSFVTEGTFVFPSFHPTGISVLWLEGKPVRYLLLTFTNPDTVSAYCQLGVLFVAGNLHRAARPVLPGAVFDVIDPSVQRRAIGGARSSVLRTKFHAYQGVFHLNTPTERDSLATMFDTVGATESCVLAVDPDTPQMIAYGVLDRLSVQHRVGSIDHFDIPYAFVEDVA